MSNRNAHRRAQAARLYALFMLPQSEAHKSPVKEAQEERRRKATHPQGVKIEGAFGGPRRDGIKLVRKMLARPDNKGWMKLHPRGKEGVKS